MKLWIIATLATLVAVSFTPHAAAVDLCDEYGLCLPPASDCEVNALAVRLCDGDLYVCSARYMGGGSQWLVGNFIWDCRAVMA